jgi:hypothetical protein
MILGQHPTVLLMLMSAALPGATDGSQSAHTPHHQRSCFTAHELQATPSSTAARASSLLPTSWTCARAGPGKRPSRAPMCGAPCSCPTSPRCARCCCAVADGASADVRGWWTHTQELLPAGGSSWIARHHQTSPLALSAPASQFVCQSRMSPTCCQCFQENHDEDPELQISISTDVPGAQAVKAGIHANRKVRCCATFFPRDVVFTGRASTLTANGPTQLRGTT